MTAPATGLVDVWVHCPDQDVADRIAEHLLAVRLVATASLYPAVRSRYRWREEIQRRREIPLRLRTRADLFEDVVRAVGELHPYEVPGIVAVPIMAAAARYREWILAETGAAPGESD